VVAGPEVTRELVRTFCKDKLIEQIPLDERGKVRRSVLAAL